MEHPPSSPGTLRGRSVFVTGAYGLLGSWLVKALIEQGARTTVLKRDAVVRSALVVEGTERRVNVVHGDICDADLIERAVGEYEVDTVFHLAAQTIVGIANTAPAVDVRDEHPRHLDGARGLPAPGVRRVVVAASDKAYGIHDRLPYQEDFALQPRYPYDVSKAATDMIARSYWHTFGLPVAVTRFANLYGGGDLNLSRLVPEAALAAIEGRRPVIRSDGTLERDFLYVEDAVAAYLAICRLLDEGAGAGEAFNAGGDAPHSVLEVVESDVPRRRHRGRARRPRDRYPARRDHPPMGRLDQAARSSRAGRLECRLEEGLRRTIEWYREYVPRGTT